MINELLMQVDFSGFWAWFASNFWIIISSYGVVIGAAILFGIYFIRKVLHDREPTKNKLGIYDMRIPHISEDFSVTVYDLDYSKKIDRVVNGLIALHKDNHDEMHRVAAILQVNRHDLYCYLGKYKDFDKSTRKHGMALIITNAPLNHSEYYREKSSGYDRFRGEQVHSRMVSDADFTAIIKDNADRWERRETVDYIYYPLKPLVQNASLKPGELKTLDVHFGVVAQMNQMTLTLEKSQFNKIVAKAADDRANKAESGLRRMTANYNYSRRQWSKKDYWVAKLTTLGTGMSIFMTMIPVGAAMFLTEPFSRWLPGYTIVHYIGLAGLIGVAVVWFISRRIAPSQQRE